MKTKLFLLSFLFSLNAFSQIQKIKLVDCINAALKNKAGVQAIKMDSMIAGMQSNELLANYFPQISLTYEYRYNPVITSQIVPVGQFYPVSTEETKAIKFGTDWQQNAGINIYQPIIDMSVKSRISESKINERITNANLQIAEDELKYEVVKSFSSIFLRTLNLRDATIDTTRTFKSLELIKLRFDEGKIVKLELNNALLNHNNALSNFRFYISELIKEKIYLSFLTGIKLPSFLESEFDISVFEKQELLGISSPPSFDSIGVIKQFELKVDLIKQQIHSEKRKYIPTIGLQGFVGANQFSNKFDPFLSNSWYGNSYVGLSLKIPVLFSENTGNRIRQFNLQSTGINYRIQEEQNRLNKEALQLTEEINYLNDQILLSIQNVALRKENVKLWQERLEQGQINVFDLNNQELELQKEENVLNQRKTELLRKTLDKIYSTGNLNIFIRNI